MTDNTKKLSCLQNELNTNEAAFLISNATRYYYSGFNADDASMLITKENAYFFTDSRYSEPALMAADSYCVLTPKSHIDELIKICLSCGITTVFTDISAIPALQFFKTAEKLKENGIELSESVKIDSFIKHERSIKNNTEISKIKQAQEITDKTFSYILPRIEIGRTEREIMLDMEFFARSLGSEGVAFDFIVLSGENTSVPHGVPNERKVQKGDFITMDFGAVIGGYRSDMTRTVAVGGISERQRDVYNTVLHANKTAVSKISAGLSCRDADNIARDIISTAGFGKYFGHALGHGVGIEIHEAPSLSPRNNSVLKAGNVVTIEPGIYIPRQFGVRIEDMVIITENGCEDITASEKELIIL